LAGQCNSDSLADLSASFRSVVLSIVRYLVHNPDAKDTLEGISKWWRAPDESEWTRAEVSEALDLLVKREWVNVREIGTGVSLYGVNPRRLDEMNRFLAEIHGGFDASDEE
jgi:hypothetical protein